MSDDKTLPPTGKKLDDARAKGDVPMAPEMRHAIMFVAATIVAAGFGGTALDRATPLIVRLWGGADDFKLDPATAQGFATGTAETVIWALAPLLALLSVFALATGFAQGLPTMSWSRVGLKWSKLSPVAGLGRVFGPRAMIEFGKTLMKLIAVVAVAAVVVAPQVRGIMATMDRGPEAIGATAGAVVTTMLKAMLALVGVIALCDLVYQRFAFFKRMRMSLQEVKDELKQSDGDPAIKARIRSIGVQRARRRMMAAVPDASVVLTNPTHYAVALQYRHGDMAAPVVVAKGADAVALKIREVAKSANVPIVESPVLARAIFAGVEIGRPIPTEHYAAVAEIIGYIMRLSRLR